MTAALSVPVERALAFRLLRHHLITPAPDPLAVASCLIGAQAQVHSAGVFQLLARSDGAAPAAIEDALYRDRSLVKLWAQRSTLHLVPTADLGLIIALRRHAIETYRRWVGSDGVSEDQIDRLAEAIAEAIAEAPMSRADLAARLAPVLGDWARPWLEHSWGGAIKLAAAMGLVCHGPDRDREATFVRLQRWVDLPPVPDDRTALRTVLVRYLSVFGPAGPADFAKFTGLRAGAVRTAFEAAAADLVPVSVDGRQAWVLAADEAVLREAEPPAGHLAVLPLFDPWLLAHADTTQTVRPGHRKAIYRTAGWISATVLRQGRVVAVWSHRRTASGWSVTLTPLVRVTKTERRRIAARLARLAGMPVTIVDAPPPS